MKKLVLCILVVCATLPGAALGTTYYVSKSGNDGNSCAQAQSPSTPKLTFASGLTCLSAGDTLIVHAGTYDGEHLQRRPIWIVRHVEGDDYGLSWRDGLADADLW